jgi:hypothetical protein
VADAVAARGPWGMVVWAAQEVRDYFLSQTAGDRAKLQALFGRLADTGYIASREKFKQLGPKAGPRGRHLWEFKSFQLRFIGDFRPGRIFVIAHGTRKKTDNLNQVDIDKAVRVLAEHDAPNG